MKKSILILLGLLLFACDLVVDIEVPFEQASLTVNSIFSPDSTWSATVKLNHHILDTNYFQLVEDASVVIYRDGTPIETLAHRGNGNYKSATGVPAIGIDYEFKVTAPGYQPVTATSKIQFMPAQIGHANVILDDDNETATINIAFKDNAAEVNYYEIVADAEYDKMNITTRNLTSYHRRIDLENNDPTIGNDNTKWYGGYLLKDVLFNGKDIDLSFKTHSKNLLAKKIIVSLRTLSEEAYRYKTTAALQKATEDNPFATPTNVFTNIKNGYGIFAGYSQSTFIWHGANFPVINGITPMQGKFGDHIIISGENFTGRTWVSFWIAYSNGFVSLNDVMPVRSTESEIEVIVPRGAITEKIIVQVDGKLTVSDTDFEVIN